MEVSGGHAAKLTTASGDESYISTLRSLGLQPGGLGHFTCPACSTAFEAEVPSLGSSRARVLGERIFMTCPNHCFNETSMADFSPRAIEEPNREWLEHHHCVNYWTDTPSARCPLCGIENYREVLDVVAVQIEGLSSDTSQAELAKNAILLVSTFDGVMRAMTRGYKANLLAFPHTEPHGRSDAGSGSSLPESASRGIHIVQSPMSPSAADRAARCAELSFQNLEGARKNVREATCSCATWHRGVATVDCPTGADLKYYSGRKGETDGWDVACRVFQKRHLHQHGLGAVDQTYIDKTGDVSARVGQIVRLDQPELALAARACSSMARAFFGMYLS